jgi:hypothetical protein
MCPNKLVLSGSVVLGLILAVCTASFAQSPETEINVGVKAGVSIPNLIGGGNEEITRDYKSRIASTFGGYVEFGVKRNLSVMAEVDYAMQGGRRDGVQPITTPIPGLPALPPGSYFFADFKNTAKLNYLEVPVLFKYTWNRKSKPGFYVDAGPYFGYLINARTVTSGMSTIYVDKNKTPLLLPPLGQPIPPVSFNADTDVTASLHRFNFGITGGGGVKFPVNRDYFFVDARASYGLTTLQKNTATDGTSRTGNLVISLGYAFRVWGK